MLDHAWARCLATCLVGLSGCPRSSAFLQAKRITETNHQTTGQAHSLVAHILRPFATWNAALLVPGRTRRRLARAGCSGVHPGRRPPATVVREL